ncbi:unnamed protein product, partial [Ectocarpus fasciculatus]
DLNNNRECGYDGGDCCPASNSCSPTEKRCYDPGSDCNSCLARGRTLDQIGDGICNPENNIEECRYDGGDCCPCDCSSSKHQCGSYGYNCKDHQSDCKYPDCHDKGGIVERIGDGACDDGPDGNNNILECGYDGGDCCVGGDVFTISDGSCDDVNNNAGCFYDGGDCCECECVDDLYCCGEKGYECLNPTSECFKGEENLKDVPCDCPAGDAEDMNPPDVSRSSS